ncbi:MAG: nucleoside triphosphate pyrophosphohydrolase [Chloroflexi bacterium]|nr:nucleoside triphosphate pyrophosphohydrolase [Chloroflexota bacterium]MBM4450488.1 nucleoside triphosphate pyrophosphohydrolase [Chloroflexota bacterium]
MLVSEEFARLKEIIARLRGPDGCPWDKKQTHTSLRPYLIEESYEVLQALDEGSPQKLCEELGDLLLQIMLHAQMASEEGQFDIDDVVRGIGDKLIRRHPHVFGNQKAEDAAELELNWETLKQEEREKGQSLLSSVPGEMPALSYSQSIQRRVAGVGFDWEKVDDILDKLTEEVAEIRQAADHREMSDEFGDLLFTLVNIARRLDIDLETALRSANQRFFRRFSYMEELCRQRNINIGDLSLDEQNALWEEAKKKVE